MTAKPTTGRPRARSRRKGRTRESSDSPAEATTDDRTSSPPTVAQRRNPTTGHDEVRKRIAAIGAPKRRVRARDVEIMLAESRERAFSRGGWIFELKYDGFRLLVARESGEPLLLLRHGTEVTATFPEIARAAGALPVDVVLDGEVVVLDDAGRPSFQLLQKRAQMRRDADVERGAVEAPATAYLFDLLAVDGYDMRSVPLLARKQLLRDLLPPAGRLRFTDHVEERGEELFRAIGRMGLEGMVAKLGSSPYRAGRSADWLKVRHEKTGEFLIVGFTEPRGARPGLGALHLAVRGEYGLRYAGRVGTGLDDRLLSVLRRTLDARRRATPVCSGAVPKGKGQVWVEPELVCEVRYREWTRDGCLRHPVFLRLRPDKKLEDCTAEGSPAAASAPTSPPRAHAIHYSNLGKVFWPEDGYTKGDLIEYYRRISPWLVPYLRDRPLVLTRFPDGIHGKSFFQKDAPAFVPAWVRTERVWSEHAGREIDYFVCDDVDSLLYLVNLGTIPLHLWSSRVGQLERPDWCILDLDPKGAPFAHVVELALAFRRWCDAIELPSFVKTSGATGLHVLVPLGAQFTHEESRTLGELLARFVNHEHPEISTITRKVSARGGRVYLDYLQNRQGQTIAGPFSARPLPGAPVSTPLDWEEVGPDLDPRSFTIATAPARLEAARRDPLREVLILRPNLTAALVRLTDQLDTGRSRSE
jgi:bifunctional non-homologous end joining protein LigD